MFRICNCISFDNFELNLEMRFEQKEKTSSIINIDWPAASQPVAQNRQNQVSKNK